MRAVCDCGAQGPQTLESLSSRTIDEILDKWAALHVRRKPCGREFFAKPADASERILIRRLARTRRAPQTASAPSFAESAPPHVQAALADITIMARRQTLKKIGGSVATVLPNRTRSVSRRTTALSTVISVAFMAAYTFLGLNGRDLETTELEVVAAIDGVAAGRVSEPALATWFRDRLGPVGRRGTR